MAEEDFCEECKADKNKIMMQWWSTRPIITASTDILNFWVDETTFIKQLLNDAAANFL